MFEQPDWLGCRRGGAPLIVSMPHTGTEIPGAIAETLRSLWLARKDADWHIERLYDFAIELDATVLRTWISRTVIDVNRDPAGTSLYPGQPTTELCPTTTFDGEALYSPGQEPSMREIARRREAWFDPYHTVLRAEIARLRQRFSRIVVYDCHSIRSRVPRLFAGMLPHYNIGTNHGRSCDVGLTCAVESAIDASRHDRVTNGRFVGGYITRHHGWPFEGVHAIQMALAMRLYLDEAAEVHESNWPPDYEPERAAQARSTLLGVLEACLKFAAERSE